MIDPRTVGVFIPTYDGNIVAELAGQLIANAGRFYAGVSFTVGVSHVALARNIAAEKFLRSPYEWMLCIDADIVPGLHDFAMMLDEGVDDTTIAVEQHPTAVTCQCVSMAKAIHNSMADALVVAEYAYKDDSLRPCSFGLGFTRVHRSVFEAIQKAAFPDGQSRAWQFTREGRLFTDYYPCGPLLSQLVPNGEWKGEDHGFFLLCQLAGIIPRIEKRTKLTHIGKKGYPYQGDEAGAN